MRAAEQAAVPYYIEAGFIQLLVLLDQLDLKRTHKQVSELFHRAAEEGFGKTRVADEPYLVWGETLTQFADAVAKSSGVHSSVSVSRDLVAMLRATQYSITDRRAFPGPPGDEADVHHRVEAILRCVFPDLQHKPRLTKAIKHFEPDTGLPSVQTLIEYKFVSDGTMAKRIADEILADTRGYTSKDWETFLYVVYETHRVKPEAEWNQLLRDCGIEQDVRVIVISGEAPERQRRQRSMRA
jgi:hypothetical protein